MRVASPFQSGSARSGRFCWRSQSHAPSSVSVLSLLPAANRCDAASGYRLRIALSDQKIYELGLDEWSFHLQAGFDLGRTGLTYQARRNKAVASSGAIWAAFCAQYQKRAAFSRRK